MPGSDEESVQDASGERLFRLGPMLSHNLHIQGGRVTLAGCEMCDFGLEGVLEKVEKRGPPARMDEGDGKDEEGDAPPPPGGGAAKEDDGELLWP